MSKIRQPTDAEPAVRGYAVTHPPGRARLPSGSGWDQLLYAEAGTLTVATARGSWTVPPYRALWLPDGDPAIATNRFPVKVRSLYLASALRALPGPARTMRLSDLVRELVLHAVRNCPLDTDDRLDAALLTVLLDQLPRLLEAPLWLPEPESAQARSAADLIRRDWTTPLPEVARAVGTSRRSLERAFAASTGLPLGAWRRRARILGSLDYLGSGLSVGRTAVLVGYSSPSAFVTAFANELGATPRRYLHRGAASLHRRASDSRVRGSR